MKSLKVLNISYDCAIDQNGIRGLDLLVLDISNNNKITDMSFIKSLKNLLMCHS